MWIIAWVISYNVCNRNKNITNRPVKRGEQSSNGIQKKVLLQKFITLEIKLNSIIK